jgi:hypothetical protein
MLIQEAANLLTAAITALQWVERFGGVVRKISMPQQNGTDGVTYKNYPVSCSVTEVECNRNQRYTELCPDSSKKSVLYWEVLQAFTDYGAHREIRKQRLLKGRLRLVGWLNTNKLGLNDCNSAAKAIRSLMPVLFQKFKDIGGLFENSSVEFEYAGEEIKDSAIFQAYDYPKNIDGLLMHPYDFFAINVDVTCILNLCNYTLTPNVPINCIDNSKLP